MITTRAPDGANKWSCLFLVGLSTRYKPVKLNWIEMTRQTNPFSFYLTRVEMFLFKFQCKMVELFSRVAFIWSCWWLQSSLVPAAETFLCKTTFSRNFFSFQIKLNCEPKDRSHISWKCLTWKRRICWNFDRDHWYNGIVLQQVWKHMGPEAHVYSSKSTNGGKGLQNSKINSYFTPW